MPPPLYRLLWLEIAERQYLELLGDTRALVGEPLTPLESDSTGLPYGIYDSASDQWSTPIGDHGLMLCAVVREPATVIVLRVITF